MLILSAGLRIGAGRERDYHAIKRWMDENHISGSQVARDVGIVPVNCSRTIRGLSNSRKILRRLLELGCPEKFLSLPPDMKG
jgi:hypothetical protein